MKTISKICGTRSVILLCAIGLAACQAPIVQDISSDTEAVVLEPAENGLTEQEHSSVMDELSPQDSITLDPDPVPEPSPEVEEVVERRVIHLGDSNVLIGPEALAELEQLFERVSKWQRIIDVRVVGHTDSKGSESSNQGLSVKRAQAVADKMLQLGVAQESIQVEGKGEMDPIGDNSTAAGRAENRRVEIEIRGTAATADAEETKQWANNF